MHLVNVVHVAPLPARVEADIELPLAVVDPVVLEERVVPLDVVLAVGVDPVACDARIWAEVLVSVTARIAGSVVRVCVAGWVEGGGRSSVGQAQRVREHGRWSGRLRGCKGRGEEETVVVAV